jgi:hypothetical protein
MSCRRPLAARRIRYKTWRRVCCLHRIADTSPPSAKRIRCRTSLLGDFQLSIADSALGLKLIGFARDMERSSAMLDAILSALW